MKIMNTLTVLIAEDDTNTRMTIRVMLHEIGVEDVHEAEDGQAAEDFIAAEEHKIDLIISDWNMPRKTGYDFLEYVKGNKLNIPFLMVTARADQNSVISAKSTGVSGYLLKPFTIEELKRKIHVIFK